MKSRALILPGIDNSDSGHWQSIWQSADPDFVRVEQRDWEYPVCAEWVGSLEQALINESESVVLVAHSLGCLLVAHWAAQSTRKIRGALLVAPPSPETAPAAAIFEKVATGFLPVPIIPFNFPSIVVASSNDTYSDLYSTKLYAEAWGSGFINMGPIGHINTSSRLGAWKEGYSLYRQLSC